MDAEGMMRTAMASKARHVVFRSLEDVAQGPHGPMPSDEQTSPHLNHLLACLEIRITEVLIEARLQPRIRPSSEF